MANAPRHGVSRISREAIAVLIESIEAAKNGLQWYRDNQPQADSQADDEMRAKLDRCLTLLASAADDDRYSLPPVVMTGYQLQAALGFLAPDGTAEQMEQQVCVAARNQVRDEDEGTTLPAGLFLWLEEYPEEGLMPLDNVPEISMHSLMPTLTPPEVVNQGLLTCACRWHGDEQLQRCKLHESHVEAIHEWAGRAKHAESQLAMKVPARDELIAVLRKSALALPRFSFLLLHGGVSRVIDPSGRWVELDEVAALLEPERIDLLARDIAYPAAQAPAPAPEQADTVQLVGVKAGVETVIGTATMPPKMKARELVQSYFGSFDGGDDDASDGAMAYWAACELIDWMEKTPPVFNVQAPAVNDGLARELGEATGCIETMQREIDSLKPNAERYEKLRGMMQFTWADGVAPIMALKQPIAAPHHDRHRGYVSEVFDADVDAAVDALPAASHVPVQGSER